MIERRGDWIITEALFKMENAPDYRELGLEQLEYKEELDVLPIRFRYEELVSYNQGSGNRPTTILLSTGDMYSINIEFEKFDEFIQKQKKKWWRINWRK